MHGSSGVGISTSLSLRALRPATVPRREAAGELARARSAACGSAASGADDNLARPGRAAGLKEVSR
jgi:hypothetical protein